LTYVAPAPTGGRARPRALEPGARDLLLAGGGRFAAVAYHAGAAARTAPAAPRCRVALVDLERGRVVTTRDVCAGRDSVVGLAAAGDDALVHLALWRRPAAPEPCGGATGSRVVTLRLDTGATAALAPLDGVPGPLALGPGPGGAGGRLYAAEALPSPQVAPPSGALIDCESAGYSELVEGAPGWRVWGLDATTLAPEAEYAVAHPVRALAVTPDGDDAFALTGPGTVRRLAPAGGPPGWATAVPAPALGLAATDDRLYTVGPLADRVWALDRRGGALVQTLAVGRGPVGLALSGPA
jgi:hypothetical protein